MQKPNKNTFELVIALLTLVLSIGAVFYAIWVHQTAWNWIIPAHLGLPAINYKQAFIVGLVGSIFFGNSTTALLTDCYKKTLLSEERAVFDLHRAVYVIVTCTVELGFAWIVKYFLG